MARIIRDGFKGGVDKSNRARLFMMLVTLTVSTASATEAGNAIPVLASTRTDIPTFVDHDEQQLRLIKTPVGIAAPYAAPKGVTQSRTNYF